MKSHRYINFMIKNELVLLSERAQSSIFLSTQSSIKDKIMGNKLRENPGENDSLILFENYVNLCSEDRRVQQYFMGSSIVIVSFKNVVL